MKKIVLLVTLFFSLSLYAQKDTLSIISHSEKDFVIPKNKKLVFRGVKNELLIDVPDCKSFKASGDGLSFVSNNIYNLNPGAGKTVTISIEILLKSNKKLTEKHVFEIRNIKIPVSYFNSIKSDSIIKVPKQQFKNAIIRIATEDKNFKLDFIVNQFKIKIPGREVIQVIGNKIDDKVFSEINKYCTRYDEIVIYNISFKTTPPFNGCIKDVAPIIIKVL